MDSGCCLQLLEDGDSKSKTASNMFTETEGLKDNLSGDEEVKNQLAFGIEAILSRNNAPHAGTNKMILNKEEEGECEVKREREESKPEHLTRTSITMPHISPLSSSSSFTSYSSLWSDDKRSGSTSPPSDELRRPFLSSLTSSSSSLRIAAPEQGEEKLLRPMLPFLLPHNLSLRRHRVDRSLLNSTECFCQNNEFEMAPKKHQQIMFRKPRTPFSPEQLATLENSYRRRYNLCYGQRI